MHISCYLFGKLSVFLAAADLFMTYFAIYTKNIYILYSKFNFKKIVRSNYDFLLMVNRLFEGGCP